MSKQEGNQPTNTNCISDMFMELIGLVLCFESEKSGWERRSITTLKVSLEKKDKFRLEVKYIAVISYTSMSMSMAPT